MPIVLKATQKRSVMSLVQILNPLFPVEYRYCWHMTFVPFQPIATLNVTSLHRLAVRYVQKNQVEYESHRRSRIPAMDSQDRQDTIADYDVPPSNMVQETPFQFR